MNADDFKANGHDQNQYKKPDIISSFIPRPRLTEKLNRALTRKVTIVSAPAGYGKSTVVLDWLGSRPLRAAWVSLDEKDNDPYVFWQYVCRALSDIDRDILSDAGYVFSSRELFDANLHLTIILDRLDDADSDVF
jgi:LuxR family maltose regulon positive regulatory protein